MSRHLALGLLPFNRFKRGNRVKVNLSLDADLKRMVDAKLRGPYVGELLKGSRNDLIEALLREWLRSTHVLTLWDVKERKNEQPEEVRDERCDEDDGVERDGPGLRDLEGGQLADPPAGQLAARPAGDALPGGAGGVLHAGNDGVCGVDPRAEVPERPVPARAEARAEGARPGAGGAAAVDGGERVVGGAVSVTY